MFYLRSNPIVVFHITLLIVLFEIVNCHANTLDYRYSKAFVVQRLSIENGLSQSVVSDIIQDQEGYVWLATEDGLNRFDSYEFKIYRHDYKDKNSLHENVVNSLLEEPGKGIWIGTASGVSFFSFLNKTFTNFAVDAGAELRFFVRDLYMDSSGIIWISSQSGLFYIDKSRKKVKRFVSDEGIELASSIVSMTEWRDFILVGGTKCIWQINKKTRATKNLCEQQELRRLIGSIIIKLIQHENTLWIGTNAGLFEYDMENDSIIEFKHDPNNSDSLSDDYIQDLLFDDLGTLWIATTEGVNAYSRERKAFTRYQRQIYSDDGLSANDVLCLLLDKDGLIWLGTYTGGFNILDPKQGRFEHILTSSDVVDLGKNNTIHAIEKDSNDNLWLASYGAGLLKYNLLSSELTRPLNDLGIDYDKYVYSLLIDRNQKLWIASLDELNLWDLKREKMINVKIEVDGVAVNGLPGVNRLIENSSGIVWLATEKGVMHVEGQKWESNTLHLSLTNIIGQLPDTFTSYEQSISTIVQDEFGDYWIGGDAGLVYYQVDKNEWHHFQYSEGNHQSLSNNSVQAIFEDSHGFIWVGTGDGLNRIVRSTVDANAIYFERITTHDGLPNNAIYGILEDDENQLWISTNSGIVKYAKNTRGMDIYHAADGLSSDEFNTGAYFTDSDGRLYFGSINGVTVIKNEEDHQQSHETLLSFSRILVGDREIDTSFINRAKNPRVTQRAGELSINVKMVNINFQKLGTQRYRYRVIGLSEQWNYLGTERNIFIAGLPEGNYTLETQSRLAGQDWDVGQKALQVTVETSFWNSIHAYYVVAILVLFSFVIVIYYVSLFYKRKIIFINKKMNVENLRIREIRSDNDDLKKTLSGKDGELVMLQRQIDIIDRKLETEHYRDVTTGFYRLNYLRRLCEKSKHLGELSDIPEMHERYSAVAILELIDYESIFKKYGTLASSEFLSKISISIRHQLMSECQIFCISNGMFLFISSVQEYVSFEDDVINLAHLIQRSEFEFANGITSNTRASLTTCDLQAFDFNHPCDIGDIANKHISIHNQVLENDMDSNFSRFFHRVEIVNSMGFLDRPNENMNLQELVEQKIVSLESL